MPHPARLLALLIVVLAAPAASARTLAADRTVRLSAEAGPSWVGGNLDVAPGIAAGARLRVQLTDRFMAGAGLLHQLLTLDDGVGGATLVPVTALLRLDRAPLSPFLGGGLAYGRFEGLAGIAGAFEIGFEAALDDRWAIVGQGGYYGLAGVEGFPVLSSITFGIQAGL